MFTMRHKQLAALRRLIQNGQLPSDADWHKVYDFWLKHHDVARVVRVKPNIHRFYTRAYTANRRARKYSVPGILTPNDLDEVWERCGSKCVHCGSTQHLVFDHIVAMFNAGPNTKNNLQLLCRMCNMKKGVG